MISQSSEKHSAAQQGNLKSTDIDIDAMSVPGPRTDSVGNNGGEGAVEVKEEEDGETSAEEEKDEELDVEARMSFVSCHEFHEFHERFGMFNCRHDVWSSSGSDSGCASS
jgi:hypothetical protein